MADHETKLCSSYIKSITSDNMYVTFDDKTGNFSITPTKPVKLDDHKPTLQSMVDKDGKNAKYRLINDVSAFNTHNKKDKQMNETNIFEINDTGILSKILYNNVILLQALLIVCMYLILIKCTNYSSIGLTSEFIRLFNNATTWDGSNKFFIVIICIVIMMLPFICSKIKIHNLCAWSFVLWGHDNPKYYNNYCNIFVTLLKLLIKVNILTWVASPLIYLATRDFNQTWIDSIMIPNALFIINLIVWLIIYSAPIIYNNVCNWYERIVSL